jgi:hypothetical protein
VNGSRWRRAAADLDEARSRHEIGDEEWFESMKEIFEAAYLAGENPRSQSGFGGDEARWEAARRPIADAIDREGALLDVGCANGYLLECLVQWSPHRIEPYGLELAPALAELARRRLPAWANHIFVGNALTWDQPMLFDFVRTELVYVPQECQPDLLRHLLLEVVAPGGRLIVCGYGSPRSGVPAHPVRRIVRAHGFEPELEYEAEAPEGGGPIVEIAVLRSGRRPPRESPRTRARPSETISNS